ncbi:MAG: PLP-dependent aminotransferase family protein [Bacteroidales bacterium]|nr:PLP-dependent aminotransferase family protein [Bacteroidales bacterium]MBR5101157.1 PLP-dependent aminotransferase family protein [Bacteroidales bacterium]
MDITPLLSQNALSMRRSQIRDLLSVATRPEIISFAGGFPNPATFPLEELKDIMKEVLETEGYAALQYGSTEGVVALRKEISKLYKREEGLDVPIENILITTASQQALDLISRIFINPGDVVVCGLPSYLGALQAFWSYQGNPYGLRHNRGLDEACNVLCATGKKPKFLYSIPDFQNPSGETMTLEEREYAVGVAQKYDLLIVEDTPYKNIRFSGESLPSMYSMDPSRVIMLGTFSKTFVPGFRLGWIVAQPNILDRLIVAKQSADLCTPAFSQMVAAKYLASGAYDENLKKTCALYKRKKELMVKSFEEFMPEGVKWTNPDGGLFLFLKLPVQYDTRELFDIAIKENVAFVTGEAFHCDGGGKHTMRLNFSFASDEKIVEGVKRLANAIRQLYAKHA